MKATLKQKDLAYYISEGKIIEFITKNSNMDWNDCCDFIRDNNICSEGLSSWTRHVIKHPEQYNPEAAKWMKLFFEAHPFLEKIMIVFDD